MYARSLLLLTMACFVVALTACNGGGGTPTPTPTPDAAAIVTAAREAMVGLTTYQAAIDMELTGEGGGDVTMQVFLRGSAVAADTPDDQLRFKGEVTASTLTALPVGTVAVVGPSNLIYDPVQNVALEGSTGVGGSELFNLFLGSQVRVITLLQPTLADATLTGEEAVGAYQTWRVELAPKAGIGAAVLLADGASGTVWVDKATDLPVRFSYQDAEVGVNWTASNVDTTTPVTDEQLSFTPPAGAQVINGSDLAQLEPVANVDEAVARAGFTPLQPSYMPEGIATTPSSVGVRDTPLGPIIELSYGLREAAPSTPAFPGLEDIQAEVSQGITIQALSGAANLPANTPSGAVVTETTVRGQPAIEVVLGPTQATLTWKEGDVFYTMRSNGFSIEEVRKVAESMW